MPKEIHIQVIYEDNHYIAVNKPANVLVHSDETGDRTLADAVKQYIKHRYNKQGDVFLGVIHRIDRPVSGVVIFARTSKGLARMNKLFADRKVGKKYLAIINKRIEPINGKLTNFLLKDTKKNISRVHQSSKKGAKKSVLEYSLVAGLNGFFLLKIELGTGRSHQIRVQLSTKGCPIVGDLKYGYSRPTQDKSICLHCSELSFEHPIKKVPVVIQADMPRKQIWDFFQGMDDQERLEVHHK